MELQVLPRPSALPLSCPLFVEPDHRVSFLVAHRNQLPQQQVLAMKMNFSQSSDSQT